MREFTRVFSIGMNYFPALEDAAETVRWQAHLTGDFMFVRMVDT